MPSSLNSKLASATSSLIASTINRSQVQGERADTGQSGESSASHDEPEHIEHSQSSRRFKIAASFSRASSIAMYIFCSWVLFVVVSGVVEYWQHEDEDEDGGREKERAARIYRHTGRVVSQLVTREGSRHTLAFWPRRRARVAWPWTTTKGTERTRRDSWCVGRCCSMY